VTRKALLDAMEAAEEAFEEELKKGGFDPMFFDLELTGYTLTSENLKPHKVVKFLPKFEVENSQKSEVDN